MSSYNVGELRRRGRELAASAPPLSEETKTKIAAILRGCPPTAAAPDMVVGAPPGAPTTSMTAEPPPSNGNTPDVKPTTAA